MTALLLQHGTPAVAAAQAAASEAVGQQTKRLRVAHGTSAGLAERQRAGRFGRLMAAGTTTKDCPGPRDAVWVACAAAKA